MSSLAQTATEINLFKGVLLPFRSRFRQALPYRRVPKLLGTLKLGASTFYPPELYFPMEPRLR